MLVVQAEQQPNITACNVVPANQGVFGLVYTECGHAKDLLYYSGRFGRLQSERESSHCRDDAVLKSLGVVASVLSQACCNYAKLSGIDECQDYHYCLQDNYNEATKH